MTIELTRELEEALLPEAAAHGVSVAELSLQILREHARFEASSPATSIKTAHDAVAYLRALHPNPPKEARFNNLRELAHEGHRY